MHFGHRSARVLGLSRRHRLSRLSFSALAVCVLSLTLGACSSTATQKSSGASNVASAASGGNTAMLKKVSAILAKASKPAEFVAPGPPIDAKKASGKSIFFLVNGTTLPFVQSLIVGVKQAAAAVGMSVTVGDGKFQVTEQYRLLQQAISSHPAAIVSFGAQPTQLTSVLGQAKADHIPVIGTVLGDPGLPTKTESSKYGIFADATYCYSCGAALVADWAIVHDKGNVHAVMMYDPSQGSSLAQVKGFRGQLEKWCPNTCQVKLVQTPVSNQAQAIASASQAAVQNPKTNFIFPQYDGEVESVLPAVNSAGAQSRVAIGSYNADLAQMQEIAKGTPMKIDVGSPEVWMGWAIMDEALRAIVGAKPAADEKLPTRVFDTSNIGTLNLSADPETWYGNIDYRASFKKLWGLG